MRLISALGTAALALAACSSNAADGAASAAATAPAEAASVEAASVEAASVEASGARHPISGLQIVPLTVIHDRKPLRFRVEVASTGQDQAKGLMFRSALGADEGMIFPMRPPRQAAFWMRNTVIPLDIIFIGTDGRITNMWENTVPYSEEPLPSTGLVKGVLEIPGGRAKQLGIVVGDKVEW